MPPIRQWKASVAKTYWMASAGVFLASLALVLVGFGVTGWLSLRLWRRRSQLSNANKVIAVLATGLGLVGPIGTCLGLVKAFGAVGGESVDPSQRATILAEGIAEAMNWTAFALVVWMASGVAFLVATVLARSARNKHP
ncbi:MAG TPA: MotA/TolQ/ExbB proton channel family protein [Polyangiaceae bacterium]|nr:MotA/TolQ/ExbB proton channel family protein [Polyangiaceae bacterium]